jgi:cob(I)alamin adenosyltransferase
MKNRVTDSHKHGKGDFGYSDLALGQRISKGSSLPLNYWGFDKLQNSLSNFLLYNPHLVEEKDLQFLKYILQMTFCINSVLYGANEPDWVEKFFFDPECIDFMIERISYFQEEERRLLGIDEISSEFVVLQGHVNSLRLSVRRVEIAWWQYRDLRRDYYVKKIGNLIEEIDAHGKDSSIVKEELNFYLDVVRERFNSQGSILNKLSSYFYWMARLGHVKQGRKFEEWMSEAPKLRDFVNEDNK